MMQAFGHFGGLGLRQYGMPAAMLAPAMPRAFVPYLSPLAFGAPMAIPVDETGETVDASDDGSDGPNPVAMFQQAGAQMSQRVGGHVNPAVDQGFAVAETAAVLAPPPFNVAAEIALPIAQFTVHLLAHKVTRRQALQLAKRMHIPHAADVVGWTRRVIAASPKHRQKMLAHLLKQTSRVQRIKHEHGLKKIADRTLHPGTAFRKTDREHTKLVVVKAVIAAVKAMRNHHVKRGPPPNDLAPGEGSGLPDTLALPSLWPWGAVGIAAIALILVASKH